MRVPIIIFCIMLAFIIVLLLGIFMQGMTIKDLTAAQSLDSTTLDQPSAEVLKSLERLGQGIDKVVKKQEEMLRLLKEVVAQGPK